MKKPVLIVGVEPRITIPIARSLHSHEIAVDVASISGSDLCPASRAVGKYIYLPGSDDPSSKFIEELTGLIDRNQYDMLIPATDAALALVSQHDANLRHLLYLACPPPETVQRVLNKSVTLEFADRAGIGVPKTCRVSGIAELQKLSSILRFPLVAKPYHKASETDFKVRYFSNYESLRRALANDDGLADRIILQEFAAGDGVGVELLMRKGEALAIFQHRRLKEVPASGGAAAVAISESPDSLLVEQAIALLRSIGWDGVAMVEFRYDRQRRQSALMEVNGRYWGTLALPIQAGLDFPWYQWQIAHEQEPTPPRDYALGVCWRWSAGYIRRWHGLAAAGLSRPSLLKELLPSFTDLSADDALWKASDPRPALAENFRQIKNLMSSDVASALRKIGLRRRTRNGQSAQSRLAVTTGSNKSDSHS